MNLYEIITNVYPELKNLEIDLFKPGNVIALCDDGDGVQYIAKWEYHQPIPEGLTLGKPGGN